MPYAYSDMIGKLLGIIPLKDYRLPSQLKLFQQVITGFLFPFKAKLYLSPSVVFVGMKLKLEELMER